MVNDPAHIGDLRPDPRNARRHTARNVGMIADALREVGAARSIVIDEAGTVLAGNATVEAAAAAGIERVQVVDADGATIIAVRRSGLSDDAKRRLALFDNRAAELAGWETDVLASIADAEPHLLANLFVGDELQALIDAATMPTDGDWMRAFEGDGLSPDLTTVNLTFVLPKSEVDMVKDALAAFDDDKNIALVAMARRCRD